MKKQAEIRKSTHIAKDKYVSFDFKSEKNLTLAHFQDFLCCEEILEIQRAKGFLYFNFENNFQYTFHCSGRQRYQCIPSYTSVSHISKLIVIGNKIEISMFKEKCNLLNTPVNAELIQDQFRDAYELINSDKRFEIISLKEASEFFLFRVTGANKTSFSVKELDEKFGVNFDEMNQDFVRVVNSTPGLFYYSVSFIFKFNYNFYAQKGNTAFVVGNFLTKEAKNIFAVIFGLGGIVTIDKMWPTLQYAADRVIQAHLPAQLCDCGF